MVNTPKENLQSIIDINLLSEIIEGSSSKIVAIDKDFKLILFNTAWKEEVKKILGLEVILGMTMFDVLANAPEDKEGGIELWKRALKGEKFTVSQKFGNQILSRNYYEVALFSLRNEGGNIIGAASIAQDNTVLKKIESEFALIAKEKEDVRKKLAVTAEELRLKAEVLADTAKEKESVRLKLEVIAKEKEDVRLKLMVTTDQLARAEKLATIGKLAGIMGHEIRNPLGVIRNSIYFLTMKFGESMDDKVKRHMEILQTEIDGCDKIISDVLDFARTKPPSITETEINSVVEASLSKASIPKTVKVQTNLGGNLPKLNIDRAQIQQVFSNIISNAIEAMPKGGELQVTTSQTDTFISIAFKDTGVGIPKENISKLFEPLFSTKPKGLGLGLAACQNIIVLHQGKIEFKSQKGQGATFIVTLPKLI